MALMNSKTLSISINSDAKKVYDFVSNPENLPKWAKMFCTSVKKTGGTWIAETLDGPVEFRFAARNDFGILDQYVSPSPGVEIFVPMRVVPNGGGSEVTFTLFQPPGMTDENFLKDIGLVEQDLKNLKNVMEHLEEGS